MSFLEQGTIVKQPCARCFLAVEDIQNSHALKGVIVKETHNVMERYMEIMGDDKVWVTEIQFIGNVANS